MNEEEYDTFETLQIPTKISEEDRIAAQALDQYEVLQFSFLELSRAFQVEPDAQTKVRISCELRGLHDQLKEQSTDGVKQKRVVFNLGRLHRKIVENKELPVELPDNIRSWLLNEINDMLK